METLVDVRQVAKTAHEVNRAFCETIGDNSIEEWDLSEDWQKNSIISGVSKILNGQVRTPEDSHIAWMEYKQADGWVYGEEKDATAKTHPCLVHYDQLSDNQKAKDHLFFAAVMSFVE